MSRDSTRRLGIEVTNRGGTGTLSGDASTAPPFSILGETGYSLGPGESQRITVQFSPDSLQSYDEVLRLTGAGGATIRLTGIAFDAAAGIIGDVNGDGTINIFDATLISYYFSFGEESLNTALGAEGPFRVEYANVDRAGGITEHDATLLRLHVLLGVAALNDRLADIQLPLSHSGEPAQ